MNKINFSDTDKVSQLFKQAVNKAIENHRQKGESIAISDEQGKVKIIPADEIPKLQTIKSLGADLKVDITEEDITEARKEMWGNFPRKII